ncbi:MAG: hypothetical protein AB2697_20005 [Candidatus Thiodiazotropha endolucinida]
MAGERKGKTYEAIVFVVLEQLKKKGKFKGDVFWNKTPKGMTIEPDLVVGKDIDHPSHIFLITHSGSAKNSDMKFWRNMGELAEAKTFVATIPHVFNIAFDSVIKEDLKKIQAAAFDGQLIVGDTTYGDDVQAWVDQNQSGLPTKAEDKASEIASRLVTDGKLKKVVSQLTKDVESLIKKRRPELENLWKMERSRKVGKAPTRKETFVRRGLSKLLIFEDMELALRLYRRKRVKLEEVPQYAFELGLARKSIGRAAPGDDEILNAVNLLTDDQIQAIVADAPLDRMGGWLVTLRNTPQLEFIGKYVLREYKSLCNPSVLARRLRKLYLSPEALVQKECLPENWPPNSVWLAEYLIEFTRVSTESANGYGYAQLARELADPHGAAKDYDEGVRSYLLSPWGHLSEWIHRVDNKKLPDDVVDAVACVLSAKLRAIDEPKKVVGRVTEQLVNNIIEAKLCTYRSFEALWFLIRTAVAKSKKESIRTCFGEAAKLGRQAGKTTIARVGDTIINWQSASDAGRDHKKKELCGRAVGLRYSWDEKKKQFVARAGIKKMILVVDGTWRQSDIEALYRAGWDEIFYPDEMDKLAKAIV